jgi:hypothetical protein
VYNVIAIEDFGTPAIMLVNQGFENDARSAASSKGMPGVRVLPESIVSGCTVMEEIEDGIKAVVDDIIAALTRPLTEEENSPKQKRAEEPSRVIFKGDLQEINRFFYQRGWTDGLPIIPPTEEAVAEMLTGTDLPADHVVTKIIPRLGKATVEKIAINAVMAGALPTCMPLLIAGVQALMDPKNRFDVFEVSTASWAPFWIVNGPIRNDIRLNCSWGALSPGNMANATLGRAMGLIIKNIGGARGGVEDMGVLGNPLKYTCIIGENEEESSWEPLHVERGFKKEDSTLTLFFPNNFNQAYNYGSDTGGILNAAANRVWGAGIGGMVACFVFIPTHIKTLSREGWTKQKVKEFIFENATMPFNRSMAYWTGKGNQQQISVKPLNPQDPVRMINNLDNIMIISAGGPGMGWLGLMTSGMMAPWQSFVTKKVEFPKNWDKLVAKYKNIVPTYVRY